MEIEIKARAKDLAKLKSKLFEKGAQKTKDKHQLDVYLSPSHKTFFKTQYYLRVRQDFLGGGDVFEFINCSKGLGDTSVCEEKEVKIESGRQLLTILKDLDFIEYCRIEKEREVFKLADFEIVLDKVKGLGQFIEVELAGEPKDERECRKRMIELLNDLGVQEESFVLDGGYVELATNTSARDWQRS